MEPKMVGSAQFKAKCLQIIDRINKDREPVTITRRGRPVALLVPIGDAGERAPIIGALRGSVLRFDEPFAPAAPASDWDANQ